MALNKPPLQGIRVLDLSRVLAGPWASQVLADLGAEVIKIEKPGSGDDTRHWGPPYVQDSAGNDTATAAYFMCANRGKSSVTIDISQPAGQEIIRQLAAQSDVLLENFKVDGLKKYHLDYASLSAQNSRLVYCSITGFGQTGPLHDQAGYDLMIQGMGGMMSITGAADGAPHRAGVAIADLSAGLYATIAIQAALLERHQSGQGQYIDLALLDVQAAMLAHQASSYLLADVVPGRLGSAHPNIAPYQVFDTADGHIIIAVGNNDQFASLASVLGLTQLTSDPRFATNADRVQNRDGLTKRLQTVLLTKDSAAWLALLQADAVPCGPINNIAEVFDMPQIRHRQMRQSVTHPEAGAIELVATPMKFSRSQSGAEQPPPALGQQTRQVLSELLGYTDEQISRLYEDGVL